MEEKETPVLYAGKLSLNNMNGVDIGPLEGHPNTIGFINALAVKKGYYDCHYALSEGGKTVGALMIVHQDYAQEALEANEQIGLFNTGLSGVVGFFRSPKRVYTMDLLADYCKDLEDSHSGAAWVVLNTKQFICPSSQAPATSVSVFAHRDESGQIDALQMEFNRKENELLAKGAENNATK